MASIRAIHRICGVTLIGSRRSLESDAIAILLIQGDKCPNLPLRLHERAERRIDTGLITPAGFSEPRRDVRIDMKRHHFLWVYSTTRRGGREKSHSGGL